MKLTKIEQDNITQLSAICATQTSMLSGCKATIIAMNEYQLKQAYKHDTASPANKKVQKKTIEKAIKNLNLIINVVSDFNTRIENSMRETLGDEVVDALIDEIASAMDKVELNKFLKK
jgi:ABC-type uncharacterized transport system auxiliary subunit